MTLIEKFRLIIIANELGGDLSHVLSFSDPDGVRSGKSGWSFGICQFDLNNNPLASTCLGECGFTIEEIAALKEQTIDVKPLETKLRAAAGVIARYDEMQLSGCLSRAQSICELFRLSAEDDAAILAVADYDNQYHFAPRNKDGFLLRELILLGRPFTVRDILHFKLEHTKWGRSNPGDCMRRFNNTIKYAA